MQPKRWPKSKHRDILNTFATWWDTGTEESHAALLRYGFDATRCEATGEKIHEAKTLQRATAFMFHSLLLLLADGYGPQSEMVRLFSQTLLLVGVSIVIV
jgi:hypothetical protein